MTDPRPIYLPGPVPVSGTAAAPPPQGMVGNTGVIYGTQVFRQWAPGDTSEKQVLDVAAKSSALYRISVFGRVVLKVIYGTQKTREILRLQAPVVMTIPGQITIIATPLDANGATCEVTLTQATAGARGIARLLATGPVNLSNDAVAYTALTASNLTISGIVTAVPALATVPLVAGSVLNSGDGFQEFEA